MDRRTLVVGLASLGGSATLLLTGCGPRDADADAGGNGSDAPAGDERLVATALAAELSTLDVLERTRRRHPGLRAATDGALATHREHVRLLRGTTGRAGTGGPADPAGPRASGRAAVPSRPPQALAALARSEAQLSADHVTTAMAARSGALARVVASMAAASAQLEQVLAQASPGAGSGSGAGG